MNNKPTGDIKSLSRNGSRQPKLHIPPIKKKKHKRETADAVDRIFEAKDFMIAAAGFFISRAMAFSGFLPFASAFYASVFSERKILLWVVTVVGAILSHNLGLLSFKYILAITLHTGLMLIIDAKWARLKKVSVYLGALSFLVAGGVWVFATGALMFDTVMLVFETAAMVIGSLAFNIAIPVFYGKKKASTTPELVSVVTTLTVMLAGASGFLAFGGIDVANILCIFLILTLAFRSDVAVSTVCGLLIGLINSIGNLNGSFIIGVYALCGFLSALVAPYGKGACIFAFICTNSLMTVYVNGSTDVLINTYETLIASVLFVFASDKFFAFVDKYIPTRYNYRPLKSDRRTQELATFKLSKMAESFEAVFEIFDEVRSKEEDSVCLMIENVAQKVCSGCKMCSFCWRRDFKNTYSCLETVFNSIIRNDTLIKSMVPASFKRHCIYCDTLLGTCEMVYHTQTVDSSISLKKREGEFVTNREIAGMSAAFGGISKQISEVSEFVPELERQIEEMFKKEGADYEKVCVSKDKHGRIEVNIKTDVKKLPQVVVGKIARICNKDMIKIKHDSHITFIEKPRYSIELGVSKARRDGEEVSGDSFTSFITENRKQVIVLSDGMGSGRKARMHSNTVIFLLKTFITAGFSGKTAVCMINSMYIAKNKEEMFSSLDVTVFDLDNGCAEFIKLGGVKGFICSKKGVETVSGESLPVGVMSDAKIAVYKRWFESGESVFMVTDGVNDPDPRNPHFDDYLPDMIKREGHKSPQIAAESLISSAIKKADGAVMDDMTVVCARVKRSA